MKSDIKFPVIVDECGNPPTSHDVFICYSMRDLSYMEPIDIQNGEYQLWDADGYIVSPHIGGRVSIQFLGKQYTYEDLEKQEEEFHRTSEHYLKQ